MRGLADMGMNTLNAASWFKRLCLIGSVLAFCMVILGAYVRLSDAGLGTGNLWSNYPFGQSKGDHLS